ncbi:hypothetical protein C2S51_014056 [Perilla frutescens var. frutescens]|nr:hypothetical protein C2S51_014056 [Perilla frutescens var. frutescens]
MANQFSTFSLLLLFLLAFQEMMPSEAAMCSAPSRLFTGVCFSRGNCAAICEKEGFLYGVCKRLKCVCTKDCNNGSGGGGDGGGEGPPDQGGDGGGEQPPVLF